MHYWLRPFWPKLDVRGGGRIFIQKGTWSLLKKQGSLLLY